MHTENYKRSIQTINGIGAAKFSKEIACDT
jgi:hypothetical protein